MEKGRLEGAKVIGLLYPAVFGDEKTELVTMSYTPDGRFHNLGMEWDFPQKPSVVEIADTVAEIQGVDPYDLWIVESWGTGIGVLDALKERGIPVLAMSEMFKAIDKLVDGDLTKLEPGRPEREMVMSISMNLGGRNTDIEIME